MAEGDHRRSGIPESALTECLGLFSKHIPEDFQQIYKNDAGPTDFLQVWRRPAPGTKIEDGEVAPLLFTRFCIAVKVFFNIGAPLAFRAVPKPTTRCSGTWTTIRFVLICSNPRNLI